ncbi:MAG: CRISPR-associated protein Cas6, partial [Thiothrix sp.]|nr:CRISPR-associated protein Cas6 [Thiothrix sp.]
MLRIRLQLPRNTPAQHYNHQDLIHDAIINALTAAGADSTAVIGHQASLWTFAPLGWHRGHAGIAHSLVISTADPALARVLSRIDPAHVIQRRRDQDAGSINFSAATRQPEPDPLLPGQNRMGCFLLSPLVLQDHSHTGKGKRWHQDFNALSQTLSETINRKLSFVAGREVQLCIYPDSLYLHANPKHSVLVNLKTFQDGRKSFVIGMQAPLLLEGSEADLRLAWYAG